MGGILVFIGFLGLLCGIISIIKPLKFLYIKTRKVGALVLLGGFIIFVTGGAFIPSVENDSPEVAEPIKNGDPVVKEKEDENKEKLPDNEGSENEIDEKNKEKDYYVTGEKVEVGDLIITVTDIEQANSVGGDFVRETASGKYILVHVTVTNNDNEPRSISSNSFVLIDEDEREFSTSSDAEVAMGMSGQEGGFFLEEINPGVSESTVLPFDVSKELTEKDLILEVTAGRLFSQETVEIVLNDKL